MPNDEIRSYSSAGLNQTEAWKDKRLKILNGKYHTVTVKEGNSSSRLATGTYDIAIPFDDPTIIYSRRIKEEALERRKQKEKYTSQPGGAKAPDRGHTSVMKPQAEANDDAERVAGKVSFAGTVTIKDGVLISWTNKSGHYKVGEGISLTKMDVKFTPKLSYTQVPHQENIARLNHLVETQTSKALNQEHRMLPMGKFQAWNQNI